jgi:hypothetical protein
MIKIEIAAEGQWDRVCRGRGGGLLGQGRRRIDRERAGRSSVASIHGVPVAGGGRIATGGGEARAGGKVHRGGWAARVTRFVLRHGRGAVYLQHEGGIWGMPIKFRAQNSYRASVGGFFFAQMS